MPPFRSVFNWSCCIIIMGIVSLDGALAQSYPNKLIRWVVPWPAGGGADYLCRMLAPKLAEALGQSVIIDNRSGAAGNVGAELAAKSPPDGYTILFAYAGTHSVNPNIYKSMPFQESDFAPVIWLTSVPQVLVVNPSLPATSVKELITLAKAKPEQLIYGTPGNGTINHLSAELFKMTAGITMLNVPYKGGAAQAVAVIAGEVMVAFTDPGAILPHVKSGKVRALGVTSPKRSLAYPDLPTVDESGLPGYSVTSWNGILVPAATPPEIIRRLNADFARVIGAAEQHAQLVANGYDPVGGEPYRFSELIRAETAKWAKVVKAAGVKVE